MEREPSAPAAGVFAFAALIVGARPVNALARSWHLGAITTALACGVAAALVFWGLSTAFAGRPKHWVPAAIGVLCGSLVLFLRALDSV
jgi:hypothetical protein